MRKNQLASFINKRLAKSALTIIAPASLALMGQVHAAEATTIAEAVTEGKVKVDLNLRYEMVEQDNALKDADAFTLRTRLTYATADYYGFSSLVEFEDSRVVAGVDDYNDTLGNNPDYSVIADPETTELDQLFLKYQYEGFSVKGGRQVITFDNQRFVGHVGWRQDRQTFDGVMLEYKFNDMFQIDYGYITQRNRIFAEAKDIDSKDNLINAQLKTGFGTLSAYGYLLEEDTNIENGLDTYGLRFTGKADIGDIKLLYTAEYATQDSDTAGQSYSADYMSLEGGVGFSVVTFKVGYELLGSDGGDYGFSTPLATLHGFNGWTDQFLTTPKEGLADLYASIGGSVIGGKWAVAYHEFDADESSAAVDDLGSEINAVFSMPLYDHYTVGVKYASYSAGDVAAGKVDTDKAWVWFNAKF
ncbi:alginate export family protein [Shewanella japonica]|uniref:alginate export family protein n=1 Tax=Shewanella japonica TaxID=93973 RepID=UPI003CD0CF88